MDVRDSGIEDDLVLRSGWSFRLDSLESVRISTCLVCHFAILSTRPTLHMLFWIEVGVAVLPVTIVLLLSLAFVVTIDIVVCTLLSLAIWDVFLGIFSEVFWRDGGCCSIAR